MATEIWNTGDAYEAYVGRWSRPVAEVFVRWLGLPAGGRWLDAGCGTGALTTAILATADPARLVGLDTSEGFLATARTRVTDPRVTFRTGDMRALPWPAHRFEAVVSGLALNFVPEPARAVAESVRVAARGGTVAAYVWDYAGGMRLIRHFWDAATALDPAAAELDEGRRFPLCRPDRLRELWTDAGLDGVTVLAIGTATTFTGFDDYWRPFLGGQGPAPGYVTSLTQEHRSALRESLRARLPTAADGSIPLTAAAWAVRGTASH
ncbi:class I SAM-dependent methyltransferase [Nonomuraea gerenzanensis]|nr:class I SAM-dependent methyltransferase [Nonomuraea gerenzanensis]UBU09144.1 class I SAM-dependent methyltransferase [Nonomuraea gerenzanensis]